MGQQKEMALDRETHRAMCNEDIVDRESPMRTSVVARIQSYREVLIRRAQRLLSPAMQRRFGASDAVQEAVVQVARQRSAAASDSPTPPGPELVSLREQLRRALRDVVRNAVRFHRRKRRSVERDVTMDGVSEDRRGHVPSSGVQRVDRRDLVERALAELNEGQREIIRLRGEQELGFAEIAQRLGLSTENAKKRYHRAVKELQNRCAQLGIHDDER